MVYFREQNTKIIMRIASNKIQSIKKFYKTELQDSYDAGEIEEFVFLSFNHFLGLSKTQLSLIDDETINESELLKFSNVVKRLKQKEPIQYILERAWFYNLPFKVNKHVLIPRPETEELVQWIIDTTKNQPEKIIDIGTGSGCIAITLKNKLTNSTIHALDISAAAIEVAKENATDNNAVIHFITADILSEEIQSLTTKYDIIVSNPPYIMESEKSSMDTTVLDFEPHTALFVNNPDPILFYKAIIGFANKNLNKGGQLYFEINPTQVTTIQHELESNHFTNIEIKKDITQKERMIKADKT